MICGIVAAVGVYAQNPLMQYQPVGKEKLKELTFKNIPVMIRGWVVKENLADNSPVQVWSTSGAAPMLILEGTVRKSGMNTDVEGTYYGPFYTKIDYVAADDKGNLLSHPSKDAVTGNNFNYFGTRWVKGTFRIFNTEEGAFLASGKSRKTKWGDEYVPLTIKSVLPTEYFATFFTNYHRPFKSWLIRSYTDASGIRVTLDQRLLDNGEWLIIVNPSVIYETAKNVYAVKKIKSISTIVDKPWKTADSLEIEDRFSFPEGVNWRVEFVNGDFWEGTLENDLRGVSRGKLTLSTGEEISGEVETPRIFSAD